MSTQGIISILKDNKVIYKCIAGCNGNNANKTSKDLIELNNLTLEKIYTICLYNNFGCEDCLVIQSSDKFIGTDDLPDLYKLKFQDAKFNPRWKYGTSDFIEIVEK